MPRKAYISMKFKLKCNVCDCEIWVLGEDEPEVNAVSLSDHDTAWDDACIHIENGDYEITDSEIDDGYEEQW